MYSISITCFDCLLCAVMHHSWRQKVVPISHVLKMPKMLEKSYRLYQLMMRSLTICSMMLYPMVTNNCVEFIPVVIMKFSGEINQKTNTAWNMLYDII